MSQITFEVRFLNGREQKKKNFERKKNTSNKFWKKAGKLRERIYAVAFALAIVLKANNKILKLHENVKYVSKHESMRLGVDQTIL